MMLASRPALSSPRHLWLPDSIARPEMSTIALTPSPWPTHSATGTISETSIASSDVAARAARDSPWRWAPATSSSCAGSSWLSLHTLMLPDSSPVNNMCRSASYVSAVTTECEMGLLMGPLGLRCRQRQRGVHLSGATRHSTISV
eukprot:scaffold4961_cov114-Isochrysis_galbana.AAC.8